MSEYYRADQEDVHQRTMGKREKYVAACGKIILNLLGPKKRRIKEDTQNEY